ncbi:MAG: hypothetical protein M3Q69_10960, partial [Acidobacteriota bacterium]|nr:hypothetical protein [Acidobacteriota bacterium]
MTENDRIAKHFWDREVSEQTHVSWMGDPLVRAYINESISGSADGWALDWFAHKFLGVPRVPRSSSEEKSAELL